MFTKFRQIYWKYVNLDCCHYVGLPALAYDAYLYTTKARIGLIRSKKIYQLIEENLRGGLSFVNTRFSNLLEDPGRKVFFMDLNNMVESSIN